MAESIPQFMQENQDAPMTATGDEKIDTRHDIVEELATVYPHVTRDELEYIVSENYPDMKGLIEALDCYEVDRTSSDDEKPRETRGRRHRGGHGKEIKNEK